MLSSFPQVLLVSVVLCQDVMAFTGIKPKSTLSVSHGHFYTRSAQQLLLSMALGDYTVELQKPLGMILQERDNASGVQIKEVVEGGAAATKSQIVPGDILLQVNGEDVSTQDFDSVMDILIGLDEMAPAKLILGDGLGTLDMPKNVLKLLKTSEEAFFIDAVVRQAVREMRKRGNLGDLLNVEVVIGAGVQDGGTKGQARFFAIFSTGGSSSYSCNVSATGIRRDDESIEIVKLSAAKDEGLGQTFEFI